MKLIIMIVKNHCKENAAIMLVLFEMSASYAIFKVISNLSEMLDFLI